MDAVLIVEDDELLVRSIARNLRAQGYEADSAGTVRSALSALIASPPSLLLLDIDLPDGSGWEVLRELRSGTRAETPVIVLSGLRPNPRLVDDLQCVAVLEKPFPMESLLRLVRTAIGRSPGDGSSTAQHGASSRDLA